MRKRQSRDFYTPHELAAYFQVSAAMIRRLMRAGDLRAVPAPRRGRFGPRHTLQVSQTELDRFVRARMIGGAR